MPEPYLFQYFVPHSPESPIDESEIPELVEVEPEVPVIDSEFLPIFIVRGALMSHPFF
jgi:hypothetical protein